MDGRDDRPANRTNAAPDNKRHGADRLFYPRRVGVVRPEIAERSEWTTEREASDAHRAWDFHQPGSLHGIDGEAGEGSNAIATVNPQIQRVRRQPLEVSAPVATLPGLGKEAYFLRTALRACCGSNGGSDRRGEHYNCERSPMHKHTRKKGAA